MKKHLSILLSAALLLGGLTACRNGTGAVSDPPNPVSSAAPAVEPGASGITSADVPPLPEPEPVEPPLAFDAAHTLDVSFPKVPKGALELPVRGATGYASVQLPVWEEIPEPEPPEEPDSPAEPDPPTEPGPADPQPGDSSVPQPGDASLPGDISLPGDTSDLGTDASSNPYDWLMPAPFQPGDYQPPAASSSPSPDGDTSQPASNPEDEIIYPPGEEPIPDQPEPEEDPFEGAVAILDPGTAFTVLEEDEEGAWWRIEYGNGLGWIENRYCLINLPDVIPSMVYNATNSYDSKFVTLGRTIPDVTGRSFYPRGSYNQRLGRNEFMMPVLYSMSKHICQAQQAALAQGNTLVLYEGYRPHEVQTTVYKALTALARKDNTVREAVTGKPWNISWFIAAGYSNHQRGFAIDVTLAQVQRADLQDIGGHQVLRVREYEEYTMPTPIHELSRNAATFTGPVASHSSTAWKSATLTDAMRKCEPALALQRYCTGAGLTPLASEWWHFNDLEARTSVLDNLSVGGYKIRTCLSIAP